MLLYSGNVCKLSPSPTLKRYKDLPSLIYVKNLLTRATLLALAKSIY